MQGDGVRGTAVDAGPAAVAGGGIEFGEGRAADDQADADGPLVTDFGANAALDAPAGEAGAADDGVPGKGGVRCGFIQCAVLAGIQAFGAEIAAAAAGIEFGKAAVAPDQHILGTGPDAGVTAAAEVVEIRFA